MDAPRDSGLSLGPMQYPDSSAWRRRLVVDAVLPEGFRIAVTSLKFIPAEKPDAGPQNMNISMIRLDEPSSSFAGVFTKNAFPGWPVLVGKEILATEAVQGVLVNNKVANVGGEGGFRDSVHLASLAATLFGDDARWFPSSTGVIGWKLPVAEMEEALPRLLENQNSESLLPFAEAIMTTDAWPKVRSSSCGEGRIVATAKGAGMVEPNMATMLSFVLTDIDIPRETARTILSEVVERSFNRISVDGETSTSDTVLLISSRCHPYPGDDEFRKALESCVSVLAEDVVRNGEGCGHVFRVSISGAKDEATSVHLARAVANAPLTKTAVRGNDPNIGRILQALGSACGRLDMELNRDTLLLEIGDRKVYENGTFLLDDETESALSQYFREAELPLPTMDWPAHERRVEIKITIGTGGASASVTGSDLSEEYVKINADYRT